MALQDKTILIVGGLSNLIESLCQYLVQQNAVVLFWGVDSERGRQIQRNLGPRSLFMCVDCSDYYAVEKQFAQIQNNIGKIDIIINTIGIHPYSQFTNGFRDKLSPSTFDIIIQHYVVTAFNLSRLFAWQFQQNNHNKTWGLILNIFQENFMKKNRAPQQISRQALISMTLPMSRDLSEQQIRVLGIMPGFIENHSSQQVNRKKKKLQQQLILNQFGRQEDLFQLIYQCIINDYLTGKVFELDGGMDPNL